MLKWTSTKEEVETISKIVKIATRILKDYKVMNAMMDIEAVHCNGNPLRLEAMLEAGMSEDQGKLMDFFHDISGIWLHINRKTGKLEDGFQPRFTDYDKLSV